MHTGKTASEGSVTSGVSGVPGDSLPSRRGLLRPAQHCLAAAHSGRSAEHTTAGITQSVVQLPWPPQVSTLCAGVWQTARRGCLRVWGNAHLHALCRMCSQQADTALEGALPLIRSHSSQGGAGVGHGAGVVPPAAEPRVFLCSRKGLSMSRPGRALPMRELTFHTKGQLAPSADVFRWVHAVFPNSASLL